MAPFLLSTQSLLEELGVVLKHPEPLLRLQKQEGSLERMLLVVEWALGCLAERVPGSPMPLPSVAGEVFQAIVQHENSTMGFTAEQVSQSHSVFCAHLPEVTIHGTLSWNKKVAWNAVHWTPTGRIMIHAEDSDDVFFVDLPIVSLQGVWYGHVSIVYTGTCTVSCLQSGLEAQIQLHPQVHTFMSSHVVVFLFQCSCLGNTSRSLQL